MPGPGETRCYTQDLSTFLEYMVREDRAVTHYVLVYNMIECWWSHETTIYPGINFLENDKSKELTWRRTNRSPGLFLHPPDPTKYKIFRESQPQKCYATETRLNNEMFCDSWTTTTKNSCRVYSRFIDDATRVEQKDWSLAPVRQYRSFVNTTTPWNPIFERTFVTNRDYSLFVSFTMSYTWTHDWKLSDGL